MSTLIPANEIADDSLSFAEATMRVFRWRGGLYRAVAGEQATFCRRLFDTGVVSELVERRFLGDSRLTSLTREGYDLVIEHVPVPVVSYPEEWCAPMLEAGARLVLDLAEALDKWDLALVDAHPWNVLFEPGRRQPIFVDWGSIAQQSGGPWVDVQPFRNFWLNPLKLMARGQSRTARLLIAADALGVRDEDLDPSNFRDGTPVPLVRLRRRVERVLASATSKGSREHLADIRRLRNELDGVASAPRQRTPSPSSTNTLAPEMRDAVTRVLDELRPDTVLNLGCGRGELARLAAEDERVVVAVDIDDEAVASLYLSSCESGARILPLVLDIMRPTPARGWLSAFGRSAVERMRSSLVIAIDVVHDLTLCINNPHVGPAIISFRHLAEALSAFSTRHVLVEFRSLDHPDLASWRSSYNAPEYTREGFVSALARAFGRITEVASVGHSTLFLCER